MQSQCTASKEAKACTLPHTSMNAAAQAAGKNSPIFSSATFSDLPAVANKYLNAMIKWRKEKKKGGRLNSQWEPSVSWPGADFSVLIVGGVG